MNRGVAGFQAGPVWPVSPSLDGLFTSALSKLRSQKPRSGRLQLTNERNGPGHAHGVTGTGHAFCRHLCRHGRPGCDDSRRRRRTPEVRLAALQWKLGQATSAYTDATGQNPAVNALDMLVLVTVSRMVMEDYGVENYGEASCRC